MSPKDKNTRYLLPPVQQSLVELYRSDPNLARLYAARFGISRYKLASLAGIQYAFVKGGHELIPGWSMGVEHGKQEAAGKKAPPGPLKLTWMKWKYGDGYVLGRQKALAAAGLHGGSRSTDSLAAVARDVLMKAAL